MLMVSISATFLPNSAPVVSWGAPYKQLTEEEKARALYTGGSAQYAGTTQKWTAAALQPLAKASPKESGEGKSSQWAEL